MNKKEYDASGITQMNFKPLVDSFVNRIPMGIGQPYRGNYTTGHSLFIYGYEIARFWGNDLQIKIETMISFDTYNLLPNVNLSTVNPTNYPKVYLNGVQITDFDNWIFVKGNNQ
jgi:hypothetical protein